MAFKVNTTAPKPFLIQQVLGALQAGATQGVHIVLLSENLEGEAKDQFISQIVGRHRFQVQAMEVGSLGPISKDV